MTEEQANAIGLSLSDYSDDDIPEVIFSDDMMESWDVFISMATQWRSSGAGAYGLDYNVLPMLFRICKITDAIML